MAQVPHVDPEEVARAEGVARHGVAQHQRLEVPHHVELRALVDARLGVQPVLRRPEGRAPVQPPRRGVELRRHQPRVPRVAPPEQAHRRGGRDHDQARVEGEQALQPHLVRRRGALGRDLVVGRHQRQLAPHQRLQLPPRPARPPPGPLRLLLAAPPRPRRGVQHHAGAPLRAAPRPQPGVLRKVRRVGALGLAQLAAPAPKCHLQQSPELLFRRPAGARVGPAGGKYSEALVFAGIGPED